MNTVQVKNTVIGEGRPKICVPIVGKTKTDILEEAKNITSLPVDVVEWRVDWFDDVFATETFLFSLHSVLPKKAVRKKFL